MPARILARLESPLTGSVASFLVEDGTRVDAHESVIEVEAFKMFTSIETPVAGILRFRCRLGEVVGDGDLLAVIEEG